MSTVFYEQRPETLFIGSICDHPFPSHVHDAIEIVRLSSGEVEMGIGNQKCLLRPGDIAVVFPTVPHSYEYVSPDADGLTIICLADTIAELSNCFRRMTPSFPLIRVAEEPVDLDPIIKRLSSPLIQKQDTLRLAYLHMFLALTLSALQLQPLPDRAQSGLTQQILRYVSEHYTEQLSLDSVARALSISRTHLSHIFSQQLHINFREYINALRIDRACSLLRDPFYSISQIAYLCGYGNQRTFHRAFLDRCAKTPNQYRAEIQEVQKQSDATENC